jgi:hypothetical protein
MESSRYIISEATHLSANLRLLRRYWIPQTTTYTHHHHHHHHLTCAERAGCHTTFSFVSFQRRYSTPKPRSRGQTGLTD